MLFKNQSIATRLELHVLFISLVSIFLTSFITSHILKEALIHEHLHSLAHVVDMRKRIIKTVASKIKPEVLLKSMGGPTPFGRTGETIAAKFHNSTALFFTSQPDGSITSVTLPHDHPLLLLFKKEKGAGIVKDYRKKDMIAAWDYIPELQWGIMAQIEVQEALGFMVHLQKDLIFTGGGSLIFFLSITFLFSKINIRAPLSTLLTTTRRITQGELNLRVPIDAQDEIGTFSKSFNKMADEIIRCKETFNSILSHEIKTPLTIMKIHSDNLNEGILGPLSPSQQNAVTKISDQMNRLTRMTTAILQFYRLESQKITPKYQNIDIRNFLFPIVQEMNLLAQEKKSNYP